MGRRRILTAIGFGRLLFGLWMLIAPRDVASRWLGPGGAGPERDALMRAVGGRDLAYALGSLRAARTGADPRPWLAASPLVDGTDAVATLLVGEIPARRRFAAAAMALGTVAVSLAGLLGDDS